MSASGYRGISNPHSRSSPRKEIAGSVLTEAENRTGILTLQQEAQRLERQLHEAKSDERGAAHI